jgi:hypothetical protein
MKKLIALTLCLALVLSFSFVAMAATSTTTYDSQTGIFTTTVTADVGDQATLIAFPASGLDTTGSTNIEFIDQATTTAGATEFTYKFKNEVVANQAYTIKVGGSLLATPLSETITPVLGATGYTISGTVSNAAELNIIGDEGLDAIYNDAWKTIVTLKASVYAETFIAETVVDGTAKTFSFADVADGTYVLSIIRDGYLPREMEITVAGADIDLGDKPILGGDMSGSDIPVYTNISTDLLIDGSDLGTFLTVLGIDFENVDYLAKYDVSPDLLVDGSDLGTVIANLGSDYSAYGETIGY